MYKGKRTCETLKSIRKQIADANDIPYAPRECTHQGDCRGTCPACESEMRYIENQLDLRRLVGKVVKVVGLSSVVSLSVACAYSDSSSSNNIDKEMPCRDKELTPDSLLLSSSVTKNSSDVCKEVIISESDSEEEPQLNEDEIDNDTTLIYLKVDKKAEYPGGKMALANFLSKNIVYPYAEGNFQGIVVVKFTINRDGSVSDAEVVRSIHPILDKEALRVVNLMEKWTPAEIDGVPVRSKFALPVRFKF